MDPVYGFSAVNVEAQQRNPSSFLHWMRRILAVRREFPVLGHRRAVVISSANPSVLAFVRSAPDRPERGPVNPVLCVHNLSRLAQPAELHVERWVGPPAHRAAGPGGLPPDRHRALPGHPGALRLAVLRAGLRAFRLTPRWPASARSTPPWCASGHPVQRGDGPTSPPPKHEGRPPATVSTQALMTAMISSHSPSRLVNMALVSLGSPLARTVRTVSATRSADGLARADGGDGERSQHGLHCRRPQTRPASDADFYHLIPRWPVAGGRRPWCWSTWAGSSERWPPGPGGPTGSSVVRASLVPIPLASAQRCRLAVHRVPAFRPGRSAPAPATSAGIPAVPGQWRRLTYRCVSRHQAVGPWRGCEFRSGRSMT